jgi:hypothetical protein
MKNPVQVWHAIVASCALLLTVAFIIINQSNRITRDESQLFYLQENKALTEKHFDEVNGNLKEMSNKLTEILIEMQNKKDRDK